MFFYLGLTGQTESYRWSVYSLCCKKNTTDLVGPNKRTGPLDYRIGDELSVLFVV